MAKTNSITMLDKLFRFPKDQELYNFFMQFYAYIRSGNDYTLACLSIAKITENKIMREALMNVARSLDDGHTFAEALEREDKIFPQYVIAAVRAGEESGSLEKIAKEICVSLKQEIAIVKKVKSAFLPIQMSAIAFTFSFLVLANTIVPRYEKLYSSRKLALPWITKVIFGTVNFINTYWYILLLIGIAAFFAARWFIRTNPEAVDNLRMQIPYYKRVYYVLVQYRFSSTIIILQQAGLSVLDTLQCSAAVLGNKIYANLCLDASRNVVNGSDLTAALKECDTKNLIDPMIKNFIQTGEVNGSIPEMLDEAKSYFKDSIDDVLVWFSTKVNFLCLLPIALGIVLIYVAVFAPQFAIFQTLRGG